MPTPAVAASGGRCFEKGHLRNQSAESGGHLASVGRALGRGTSPSRGASVRSVEVRMIYSATSRLFFTIPPLGSESEDNRIRIRVSLQEERDIVGGSWIRLQQNHLRTVLHSVRRMLGLPPPSTSPAREPMSQLLWGGLSLSACVLPPASPHVRPARAGPRTTRERHQCG